MYQGKTEEVKRASLQMETTYPLVISSVTGLDVRPLVDSEPPRIKSQDANAAQESGQELHTLATNNIATHKLLVDKHCLNCQI